MAIRDDLSNSESCGCLMNRADLAFINTGYQVKVLRSTAEDTSGTSDTAGYGSASSQEQAIKERQDDVYAATTAGAEAAAAAAEADPISQYETPEQTRLRVAEAYGRGWREAAEVKAEEYGLSVDEASQLSAEGAETAEGPQPVLQTAMTREEAVSKVDDFLTNLYEALDGPHQEYEKVLRGEYVESPQVSAQDVRFGRGFDPKDQPPFAPPFSTPERARGGDLDAIAKAGSTARQDLEETWISVSDDLQSAAKRAELEAEKAQLEKKVAELREQIADMERAAEADSGAIVTTGSDLDDLKAALAEAEQDLANVTHELNVHNQEHPP
jgi:hypothetical protein